MMPQNVSFLERAIRRLASSNVEAYRLRVMMANVVVGQFLENAVARGGTSISHSRTTAQRLWYRWRQARARHSPPLRRPTGS